VLRLDGALDGVERVDGKIQSGVKPPQSKKPGSGRNFLIQISNFRFLHSFPAPKPSTLDSRLSTQSPYLRDTPSVGFRFNRLLLLERASVGFVLAVRGLSLCRRFPFLEHGSSLCVSLKIAALH
jgi:hypothetical protein